MTTNIIIVGEGEPAPPPPAPAPAARPKPWGALLAGLLLLAIVGGLVFLGSRPVASPFHAHSPNLTPPTTGPLVSGTVIIDPFANLVEAARRGEANAQARLGEALRYGVAPLAHDPRAAIEWLKLAAARGHPEALRHLGEMVLAGEGTVPDPASGVALLFRAAGAGSVQARQTLRALGY